MGADRTVVSRTLNPLPSGFTYAQLSASIAKHYGRVSRGAETIRLIHWLASSNYVVTFPRDSRIDERVIFPAGPNESRGMEDARFVRFVDDDGSMIYYATYTAFDGVAVLPQIIETRDFLSFRIATLNGSCAENKGMALFPRQLHGRYGMLSRQDGENLYMMTSDWLVLTHGVGPMRRDSIGAMLLDLDHPQTVIAYLPEPILAPVEEERDGYVPNVVYSCGSLVHGDQLMLPYGFSDSGIAIATLSLSETLETLKENPV
jgi:predicted GH43/DUF377 family glycosyl hydrolase